MVNIVEGWDDFEEATDRCRYGIYQVSEVVGGIEVRVMAGRFGFIATFSKEDEQLRKILTYCESEGFIKRDQSPTNSSSNFQRSEAYWLTVLSADVN